MNQSSLHHLDFDYQVKYIDVYVMGGLHGRIFTKMKLKLSMHYTSSILLCILKKNLQKPTHLIFRFFWFHIIVEVN